METLLINHPSYYIKNLKIELYRTIIFNFACCSVWVRNLVAYIGGGTRLRVFENRALKRIFGPKRDEVTEEWRKLHNEELSDLYCTPNFFFG